MLSAEVMCSAAVTESWRRKLVSRPELGSLWQIKWGQVLIAVGNKDLQGVECYMYKFNGTFEIKLLTISSLLAKLQYFP